MAKFSRKRNNAKRNSKRRNRNKKGGATGEEEKARREAEKAQREAEEKSQKDFEVNAAHVENDPLEKINEQWTEMISMAKERGGFGAAAKVISMQSAAEAADTPAAGLENVEKILADAEEGEGGKAKTVAALTTALDKHRTDLGVVVDVPEDDDLRETLTNSRRNRRGGKRTNKNRKNRNSRRNRRGGKRTKKNRNNRNNRNKKTRRQRRR